MAGNWGLTLALSALVMFVPGYYIAFSAGVLVRGRRMSKQPSS